MFLKVKQTQICFETFKLMLMYLLPIKVLEKKQIIYILYKKNFTDFCTNFSVVWQPCIMCLVERDLVERRFCNLRFVHRRRISSTWVENCEWQFGSFLST